LSLTLVDREFWHGKAVFLTGHTGFKGGWLAAWLADMGARVHGYALFPDTDPSYFGLCGIGRVVQSTIGDICDANALYCAVEAAQPEIVFHLAAQPLVRRSYREPAATFATNIMGAINVLEAVRATLSVRAVVAVTSDKCYEDAEGLSSYRESDPLGGHDPYGASKACAEIVCAAYRRSFFENGGSHIALATARAGNVIGGGDWSEDRIIPDAVRAFTRGDALLVRNPRAVRPWQHVLNPLSGYLTLAMRLYQEGAAYAGAWNFGPRDEDGVPVSDLVENLVRRWGGSAKWRVAPSTEAPRESSHLRLDSSKARVQLGWFPCLDLAGALDLTVRWYRDAATRNTDMYELSRAQIRDYEQLLLAPVAPLC
jgi:CDP-glucose 4,6-dehydratase